jgi:acyl-CoA hydrolase
LPGQGQVYVKHVHFILNNIRQGEIVALSKRTKNTKKSLVDVNTAIRSEMLDEASLILEDIRNNLTHKLYEMKFNEIARKRLLGKPRSL